MSVADSVTQSATTDSDLPPEVEDCSAWYGSKLAQSDEWIVRLTEAEIAEVERAVEGIERSRAELTTITGRYR